MYRLYYSLTLHASDASQRGFSRTEAEQSLHLAHHSLGLDQQNIYSQQNCRMRPKICLFLSAMKILEGHLKIQELLKLCSSGAKFEKWQLVLFLDSKAFPPNLKNYGYAMKAMQ